MKFGIILSALFILSVGSVSAQKTERPAFEMTKNMNLPVGTKAPAIELQYRNGAPINLEHFRGKTIILDIWATWCIPCRAELPVLDSLATTFATQDVVMIAVCSADSKQNFDTFFKTNKTDFKCTFLFDPLGKSIQKTALRSIYGINGFPTTMVINKQGVITGYGFNAYEIKSLVTDALK